MKYVFEMFQLQMQRARLWLVEHVNKQTQRLPKQTYETA